MKCVHRRHGIISFSINYVGTMEKLGQEAAIINGSRQSDLKKSFKLAIRSLLTACSKQEFSKAFSKFTSAEQEYLHCLFIKVITSLHGSMEDEFESLCVETQVGIVLDTVEQLVEEQGLDPLFSDKTDVMDIAHDLSTAKKDEIRCLMHMLGKAEEENCLIQARVEVLKKLRQDISAKANIVEKLKTGIPG